MDAKRAVCRHDEPEKASESKLLAIILWVIGLALAGVYMWRLFEDAAPVLPWKPFAALEVLFMGGGLVAYSRAGDAIDAGLDIVREKWGGDG